MTQSDKIDRKQSHTFKSFNRVFIHSMKSWCYYNCFLSYDEEITAYVSILKILTEENWTNYVLYFI